MSKYSSPVYGYVCPKCLANIWEPCIRVRKTYHMPLSIIQNPHAERYAVWKAWEQPDLFDVRLTTYE